MCDLAAAIRTEYVGESVFVLYQLYVSYVQLEKDAMRGANRAWYRHDFQTVVDETIHAVELHQEAEGLRAALKMRGVSSSS